MEGGNSARELESVGTGVRKTDSQTDMMQLEDIVLPVAGGTSRPIIDGFE